MPLSLEKDAVSSSITLADLGSLWPIDSPYIFKDLVKLNSGFMMRFENKEEILTADVCHP